MLPPGPRARSPIIHTRSSGSSPGATCTGCARRASSRARAPGGRLCLSGRRWAPNYRTLARFRRDNAAAFTAVFQETVLLALRLGLAQLGHVALDGTKLKANASKHKTMSYGRLRLRGDASPRRITRLVEHAEVQDDAEDEEYGADSDGYSVVEELARREQRLAKIQGLRERWRRSSGRSRTHPRAGTGHRRQGAALLRRRRRSDDAHEARRVRLRLQRPDCRRRRERGHRGAMLTNTVPDVGHLPALVGRVRHLRAVAGLPATTPTTVSADTGYFSKENVAQDGGGIDLLIAAGRDDPATPPLVNAQASSRPTGSATMRPGMSGCAQRTRSRRAR